MRCFVRNRAEKARITRPRWPWQPQPATVSLPCYALQAGWGEYVVVRPDVGLFFPAMGLVRDAVLRAAAEEGGTLPVVLDCSRFSGLDFTAVKVPDGHSILSVA